LTQLGHPVIEEGGTRRGIRAATARSSSSNSRSAAASVRDNWPDGNAAWAVGDAATSAAALTVSRCTDSVLATRAGETPVSSIWWMPRARCAIPTICLYALIRSVCLQKLYGATNMAYGGVG
jgi:hypothetical protein